MSINGYTNSRFGNLPYNTQLKYQNTEMLNYYHSFNLQYSLSSYRSCKKRVKDILSKLGQEIQKLLANTANFSILQNLILTEVSTGFKNSHTLHSLIYLKIYMLTHFLLLEAEPKDSKQLRILTKFLDPLFKVSITKVMSIKGNSGKDAEYLYDNLVIPYGYYLQKKLQFIENKLDDLEEENKNQISPNLASPQYFSSGMGNYKFLEEQSANKNKTEIQRYSKCYHYVNLLNKGLLSTNKLNSIFRYFGQKYLFISDFNRLVARDFGIIYNQLRKQFQMIQKLEFVNQFMGLETKTYSDLVESISSINDGLYVVFLNSTNYKELRPFKPTFITLQQTQAAMYQSCKFLLEKVHSTPRNNNKLRTLKSLTTDKDSESTSSHEIQPYQEEDQPLQKRLDYKMKQNGQIKKGYKSKTQHIILILSNNSEIIAI